MRTPGKKNDYIGTDQLKTKATQARSLNGVAIFIRILCSSFVKNTSHYSSQLNRSPGRKQSSPGPKGVPPIGLLLFTTTNTLNSHKGSVREAYNTATSDSPQRALKNVQILNLKRPWTVCSCRLELVSASSHSILPVAL